MKPIKIGTEDDGTYELIETAEQLSARRYAQLKEFFIQKESGVAVPSLIETLRGFIKNFDSDSKAGMLITLHNYLSGINQVNIHEDADQMIFTIIVLEKGEDVKKFDKTQAKEKLQRMMDHGLTQGQVVETVTNFLKGSPILLSYYLTMGLMSRQPKNTPSSDASGSQ